MTPGRATVHSGWDGPSAARLDLHHPDGPTDDDAAPGLTVALVVCGVSLDIVGRKSEGQFTRAFSHVIGENKKGAQRCRSSDDQSDYQQDKELARCDPASASIHDRGYGTGDSEQATNSKRYDRQKVRSLFSGPVRALNRYGGVSGYHYSHRNHDGGYQVRLPSQSRSHESLSLEYRDHVRCRQSVRTAVVRQAQPAGRVPLVIAGFAPVDGQTDEVAAEAAQQARG